MSIEQGLIDDIRTNPGDDTPRLVYADWLEDAGGETQLLRAELIRAQVELARFDPADRGLTLSGSGAIFPAVWREGGPLPLGARVEALARKLFRVSKWGVRTCTLQRGFIVGAELRFTSWTQFARVCQEEPIRHLYLTRVAGRVEALVQAPELQRIESLVLPGLTSADVRQLGGVRWPRLRYLQVQRPRLADALDLAADALPAVRALNIGEATGRIDLLAEPGGFTLSTMISGPTPADVSVLAEHSVLADVRRLRLCGTMWRTLPVEALARSTHLTQLEWLDLGGCSLSDMQVADLLKAPWVANLRALDLRHNFLGQATRDRLIHGPLANIELLDISHTALAQSSSPRLLDRYGDRLIKHL